MRDEPRQTWTNESGEHWPGGWLGGPAGQHDLSVETLTARQPVDGVRTAQSVPRQDLLFDLLVRL